jgi:hypothetical protein
LYLSIARWAVLDAREDQIYAIDIEEPRVRVPLVLEELELREGLAKNLLVTGGTAIVEKSAAKEH